MDPNDYPVPQDRYAPDEPDPTPPLMALHPKLEPEPEDQEAA